LGAQQRVPDALEHPGPEGTAQPVHRPDVVQVDTASLELGDVERAETGAQPISQPEGAEPEEIEGRVEPVEPSVDEEPHPRLAPVQLVGQTQLADQPDQLGVAVEDDVVVAVERDAVVLEVRPEPTELPGGLEDDGP